MAAVCSFLLASSSIPAVAPYSMEMRVVGALVVIVPFLWRKPLAERGSFPQLSRTGIEVGAGFGIYLIASTFAHGDSLAGGMGLISFLLVAILVCVLLYLYSGAELASGVYVALAALCAASIAAQRVLPDIASENDRLRGVFENANVLGFVAFVMGAVSLAVPLVKWKSILGLGLALICLSSSGSRAGMLALVVFASGLAMGRVWRARFAVAFGAIAICFVWLIAPGLLEGIPLLRTTDTRSNGFEVLARAMSESFWTGLGELPEDVRVAGSPFAAGITGGMWGLVGLGSMYVALMRGLIVFRPRAFTLVVAAIAHSFFESWMLSFSAPMLLTFCVVLVTFVQLDTTDEAKGTVRHPGRLEGGRPLSDFVVAKNRGVRKVVLGDE